MKALAPVIVASLILGTPLCAHAGDGRAILPSWFKDGSPNSTSIFISNISNEQVTIYVKLFKENGDPYDEASESGTNFLVARGFSGDPLSVSGATLDTNATGEFRILGSGPTETGYGVIEWESSGRSRFAVIAFARYTFTEPSGIAVVPVNDLQPF